MVKGLSGTLMQHAWASQSIRRNKAWAVRGTAGAQEGWVGAFFGTVQSYDARDARTC